MGVRGAVSGRWRAAVGGAAVLAATVAVSVPVAPAGAASLHTWVGPAGGRWSVASNWSPAEVPHDGASLVLPSGSSSIVDVAGLDLGDLTFTGGAASQLSMQSPVLVVEGDLVAGGPLTVRSVGTAPASLQVQGAVDVPALTTSATQVVLAGGTGMQSVGSASASGLGTDWVGSVNLLRDGQHDAATPLTSSPFGRIDLWASDQQSSSTVVGGSLYLGYWDEGAVTSVLQTGSLLQTAGGHIAMQLGTTQSDQIRATSVELHGDLTFGIDGIVPVGTQITVIDNQGSSPVVGSFAHLPEGSAAASGQQRFRISYTGGTGNDVTLTRIAGLLPTWWHEDATHQGGFFEDAPGISSWGPGRLDAWVIGGDDALWHRWQQGSQSGWERVGGIITTSPAAVSQAPGQYDVFVRGADNALWMRSYRSGAWGAWRSLGGIITAAPAVTSSAPGTLEVVVRGADGGLWMRRQVAGTWQAWANLGGYTTSAPAITDWGAGELQIAIRGGDGALWLRQMRAGAWGSWRLLGGAMQDGPAMAAPEPGQLVVYVKGGDGRVWERTEEGAGWSLWASTGIVTTTRPAAVGIIADEVELAVRTGTGALDTHTGHQPTVNGPRDLSSS